MPKKKDPKHLEAPQALKGWKAIGEYLGIGAATAQHWAKSGMPVRRQGRYTVADPTEIREWLGREAHMPGPAHVLMDDTDISRALKESITAVHRKQTE